MAFWKTPASNLDFHLLILAILELLHNLLGHFSDDVNAGTASEFVLFLVLSYVFLLLGDVSTSKEQACLDAAS